jgi:N6-L-threonylcarbamoyladenine synthase
MGLPYPGGPHIERLAQAGNPEVFKFSKPQVAGYDYSFSGLKTSFLYLLRDKTKEDPAFVRDNQSDLSASLQATIVDILMKKLTEAAKDLKISEIAVAGGVSANKALRNAMLKTGQELGWKVYIPPFSFTTDNGAMIAITGYYKYLNKDFCDLSATSYARVTF